MSSLTLSYSKISTYQTCPLQFKLSYVEKLPRIEKPYFSFGTSLHAAAEFMYKKNVPPPPSLEEVLDYYHKNWKSEGYKDEQEEKEYLEYGQKLLKDFYNKNIIDYHPALAVEDIFSFDLDGIKVTGIIDRLDKISDTGVEIIDYKSGKSLPKHEYLLKDSQLSLYRIAVEKMYGLPVEKQTIYHLRSNTPFSVTQTREQLEETKELVSKVSRGILDKEFEPIKNNFCPCDWPSYCPYYKDEYGPPPEEQPSLERYGINEAIEEYGHLNEEIKEKGERLGELKKLLSEYCQQHELYRLNGENYQINYTPTSRVSYPEDAVRNILEPLDLWPKVLDFKPKLLAELIKDGSIPPEIVRKIKELAEIKKSYSIRVKKVEE